MADVICLSSDDEDEIVFTEVESGEDLDAKPEAIQAVFLPENLPDCLSPDSEVSFGNLANKESTLSVAPTESTIEDPFSCTNDEETTLKDVAFPELINENPLPSLDGGNMPEQEHSQSDKCLKLKLLAEQLAKALSISKDKKSVIKKNNLIEGKTSRLFQRDSEKTIKSKSKGGRRGRPPRKNVVKYNESTRNVDIENPEKSKKHFNLTPTSTIEKVILQVSQGHFGSDYRTEFRDKKDNKRPCKRAESLEDFNGPSKKLKVNEVRCETITSNSFDEKCSSRENPENLHHEEHTVQSVVNSFIEKHFVTTVPNGSRKSIILNKYNSSPGKKHQTSCESQPATLNQLNESQSNDSEKTTSKRNQENQSPNDQEKINKLKFTFDRSNGGVSVSIVSPSQVSPVSGRKIPSSDEETRSKEPSAENVIEQKSQSESPSEITNSSESKNHSISNSAEIGNERTDILKHKSNFIECYKIVFDEVGESLSVEMGRMILATMNALKNMAKCKDIDTKNNQSVQKVQNLYENAQTSYFQLLNAIKPRFEDLFVKLSSKIFTTPQIEQYEWLFLAWFAKMFVCISNESQEFAEKMHFVRTCVLHCIPKNFKLEQPNTLKFFSLPDDKFDENFWRVIVYMQDCLENEDPSSQLAYYANAIIKVENTDNPSSAHESCTESSLDISHTNINDVPTKVPEIFNNELNENNLSPSIKELNLPNEVNNPNPPVSTNELFVENSISSSQNNNNAISLKASMCEHLINNQSITSLNTDTSLIERLNQSDCVHVSVIKNGNTIPSTSTENVSKQQQDTVNPTRLNPSDKIASSTASKSNKPNQDKKLSIMVKSPLSINKDHDESNVHSYLPTFGESFTHPVRSEFHSNDMNVQNNHKQLDQKQAFSHNPTEEHGQFMRAANGIDDSNPWNLQTLHSHSTQNPSFCHKPTPNQNLLEHRKGRNQSERFNPVDRSSLPNKKSENQRHNQPLQWLGSPPNYVLNHQNHSQPSRTTSDKQRWCNDSQIPYRPLIGGNAQYTSTNPRYQYNHQVDIQPNHIITNSPVVYDKSKPSARPGTLGHPPVNQPTSIVSAHSQIEADIQRYVSKSNNPQNMQYYQEGQNQTSLNHAMNYDKTCGPDLNYPKNVASQYLHYAWLQHYYKTMYNRGRLMYPTTPVATASVQNLHKPPPPYSYPVNPRVNMHVPPQPTPANTMKNQGYFDQTTSGNFQRSHLKPVQNWSSSNQLADLTVPNQTVSMGVPVDSNVTIKPVDSNVTINNYNFTNYGSSPTDCNYGPQNYNLPLSAENTLHPQPTKPPN